MPTDIDPGTELTRAVRERLAQAEDALDRATTALQRVRDAAMLDAISQEEWWSDLDVLRVKLAVLDRMLR